MPRPPPPRLWLTLPCLVVAMLASGVAAGQIRRCMDAQGQVIYTDRRCEDLGAIERHADTQTAGTARSGSLYRDSCPRNVEGLLYQLATAIDNRDVNRLASVYDWAGQSTRSGYALMRRLDVIANRPLADIVPVYPVDPDADPYFPQTIVDQAPVALRLEQTLADGMTPARTVLGLRRSFGCWWVRL